MKLTDNFQKWEFDSKDGARMPKEVFSNVLELAVNLQVLRDLICVPININSGYRSPEHNKAVGGVSSSQHLTGKAADIRVDTLTPEQLYSYISDLIESGDMKEGGLGLYNWGVHYDIRGTKARWDYR